MLIVKEVKMKTTKKIVLLTFAALAFASAHAGTLYWQVQEGTTSEEFGYALLKAYQTDGGSVDTATTIAGATAEGTAPNQYVSMQNTDLGSYSDSGYTFFVELANYSDNAWHSVSKGARYTYDDLVSAGYVATGLTDSISAMTAASNFNMGAVPEPTSGVLLLIGGSLLALRRRRR